MGNCLVTKLKSVVNNDNLLELNEIRLRVHSMTNPTENYNRVLLQVLPGKSITIKTDNGGTFTVNEDATVYNNYTFTTSVLDNCVLHLSNGDYNLKIYGKYEDLGIGFVFRNDESIEKSFAVDVSQLEYSPLTQLNISGMPITGRFKLNESMRGHLEYIAFSYPDVMALDESIVNCEDLASETHVSNIIKYGGITEGNIETLGSLTACEQMIFASNNGNPNLVGSIENLAAAQVANGRTSGTMFVQLTGSNCTYNGQLATSPVNITFNSSLPEGYSISIVQ